MAEAAPQEAPRQTRAPIEDDLFMQEVGRIYFLDNIASLPGYKDFTTYWSDMARMAFDVGGRAPDTGILDIIAEGNQWATSEEDRENGKQDPPTWACRIQKLCRGVSLMLSGVAVEVRHCGDDTNIERLVRGKPVDPEALDMLISSVECIINVCFSCVMDLKPLDYTNSYLEVYHDLLCDVDLHASFEARWMGALQLGFVHACYHLTEPIDCLVGQMNLALGYVYSYILDTGRLHQEVDLNTDVNNAIAALVEDIVVHLVANGMGYTTPMKLVFESIIDRDQRKSVGDIVRDAVAYLRAKRREKATQSDSLKVNFCDECLKLEHQTENGLKKCARCEKFYFNFGHMYCSKGCQKKAWRKNVSIHHTNHKYVHERVEHIIGRQSKYAQFTLSKGNHSRKQVKSAAIGDDSDIQKSVEAVENSNEQVGPNLSVDDINERCKKTLVNVVADDGDKKSADSFKEKGQEGHGIDVDCVSEKAECAVDNSASEGGDLGGAPQVSASSTAAEGSNIDERRNMHESGVRRTPADGGTCADSRSFQSGFWHRPVDGETCADSSSTQRGAWHRPVDVDTGSDSSTRSGLSRTPADGDSWSDSKSTQSVACQRPPDGDISLGSRSAQNVDQSARRSVARANLLISRHTWQLGLAVPAGTAHAELLFRQRMAGERWDPMMLLNDDNSRALHAYAKHLTMYSSAIARNPNVKP